MLTTQYTSIQTYTYTHIVSTIASQQTNKQPPKQITLLKVHRAQGLALAL